MTKESERHWQQVYQSKRVDEVSWYQPEARLSLEVIRQVAPDLATPVIDVGGGASTLVDGLLEAGYTDVTVLDIASAALTTAAQRLGGRSREVKWMAADVLGTPLAVGAYGIWHDRAVFHFLTSEADRRKYVETVTAAVRPGGFVLVATFAGDGPAKCSGLPVMRYEPEALHREFGGGFKLMDSRRESHTTPMGTQQAFIYCLCRVTK